MIRLTQLKININENKDSMLPKLICKKLRINEKALLKYHIFKESIDARRGEINFVYTVDVEVKEENKIMAKNKTLKKTPHLHYQFPEEGTMKLKNRPIIIGFGPAGMFAGLILAQRGYKPIIFERGEAVEERIESVNKFWNEGILNKESNVQFGEGGAGTFSDGKLTSRVKDLRGHKVLDEFVKFGAPEEIKYVAHPHIGTDKLVDIVKNIRHEIIRLGGEVKFNHLVSEFIIENEQITGVVANGDTYQSEAVVVAIGHSARDTFTMMHQKGVYLESKPFAIGARIEHPQKMIDKAQFGKYAGHEKLGAAEYRLTYQASTGRSVYTFCMCPGGTVVPSASEPNCIVTNGMSEYKRDKENANSAVLVSVSEDDYGIHPLAGLEFQREIESRAFNLAGNTYCAPVQTVGDFLENRGSKHKKSVNPSYQLGVKWSNLNDLFPSIIVESMKEAIVEFDKKLKGFALEDAVLTAPETRSSSPIRINRDQETMQSINVYGLYPTGEGAGYAGGIVTAAIDGIKIAEQILSKYSRLD